MDNGQTVIVDRVVGEDAGVWWRGDNLLFIILDAICSWDFCVVFSINHLIFVKRCFVEHRCGRGCGNSRPMVLGHRSHILITFWMTNSCFNNTSCFCDIFLISFVFAKYKRQMDCRHWSCAFGENLLVMTIKTFLLLHYNRNFNYNIVHS